MPAMLDDPTAPAIYRVSGEAPFPVPGGPLPPDITPKQVILRDRITTATIVPFSGPTQVPPKLSAYLCELLGREIEKGDTYPMMEPMPLANFAPYWFANFGAIMVVGDAQSPEEVSEMEARGVDWSKECLGSFYVKPNYPGRSSHVCNGGFLVTDAARGRGVGRLMGEVYLDWAPKLGYSYSVFNLVYETNVASLRIWDALGFKRIGRVKGCGNLKSYPDQLIDAIIFGRDLGGEGDEMVSEERFDKIRYYLKTGTYPNGSDRAEKSRLRSAATHYRLIPTPDEDEEDKLMLKGKEVVSDPNRQYDIARRVHLNGHGGINKTTASIADKYHWVRIKETVSVAIRNCAECKGTNAPKPTASTPNSRKSAGRDGDDNNNDNGTTTTNRRTAATGSSPDNSSNNANPGASPQLPQHQMQQHHAPMAHMQQQQQQYHHYPDLPVDPQLTVGMHHWETPQHMMQAQPMSLAAHLAAQHQAQGGGEAMHLDDDDEDANEDAEHDDEDVGSRLREELMHQSQMMGEAQARDDIY
jgi:GNAT superfamily N-acetyltransferase